MAGKSRIAEIYAQVVPTFDDLSAQIEAELEKDGVKFKPEIDTEAVSEEGKKAGEKFGANFAAAIGAAAIIKGVTDGFKELYNIGDTFDAMSDSIRIGTGATGEQLEQLESIAKNVFTSIPTDMESVSTAVADLNTRLDISGDKLEGVAKQVLEAGRLLNHPIDVNSLSQSLRIMQVDAENYEESLDAVFRVSQSTGVGMNELFTGIVKNSAVLNELGLNYQESAALMGLMDKAGLEADRTLQQMTRGIVTFAKDGQPASEAIAGVVQQISDLVAVGDSTSAIDIASQIFGTRGALTFVNAIRSGAVEAESFQSTLGTTGDTILGLAEETNDFAEDWQVAQNKMTVAVEPLASAVFNFAGTLIDDLGPSIEWIAGAISDFTNFATENEGVMYTLAAVVGGVMLVAVVAMTAALWGMAAAGFAAMAPFLPIIAGIAAVIAAFVAGYALGSMIFNLVADNWDGIVNFMVGVWDGFIGFIGDSLQAIGTWFDDLGRGIANFFIGIANFVIGAINWMISGINSIGFDVPDWLGGGHVGFSIPLIPQVAYLADGGTVKATPGGQLAVLAEAGRDEVVMDAGKWNNVLDQILSGNLGDGGSKIVTINVYPSEGMDAEEIVRKVTDYLDFHGLTGDAA